MQKKGPQHKPKQPHTERPSLPKQKPLEPWVVGIVGLLGVVEVWQFRWFGVEALWAFGNGIGACSILGLGFGVRVLMVSGVSAVPRLWDFDS